MNILQGIGFFPIIIGLAAQVFAQGGAEYNKIDGFSSASAKLHVDSILVYRDHAEVFWWEFYPDTADILKYQIEWGTKDSMNFTDTLKLQPYLAKTRYVSKIPNLKDSTAYFAQFHRDYHGTVKKTKFLINTPPMANSIRQLRSPRFSRSSKTITGIDMYSVDGKCMLHTDVVKGVDVNSIRLPVAAPGLYIINYTDAAKATVKSEMCLFGR